MDQRLALAEQELTAFFCSAVALKGQNYSAFGSGDRTAHDWEEGFVGRFPSERKAMAERDTVSRTLAYVDGFTKFILVLAYDRRSSSGVANDLLVAALTGGEVASITALAPLTARAQRLAVREMGAAAAAEASHHAILALLEIQAGKGAALLVEVKNEALALRDDALRAYAEVMVARKAARKREGDDAYARTLAGRA